MGQREKVVVIWPLLPTDQSDSFWVLTGKAKPSGFFPLCLGCHKVQALVVEPVSERCGAHVPKSLQPSALRQRRTLKDEMQERSA